MITKAIERKLAATPLYSTDGTPVEEKEVLVKFFNPTGAGTWWVFEAERLEDGDWRFFGLAEIHERELGYFHLSELTAIRGRFGLPVERDLYAEKRVAA